MERIANGDGAVVPDWIQQVKAEQDSAKAQLEADSQRQLAVALTVSAEGPAFWGELLAELKSQVGSLASIGARGSVDVTGAPPAEELCRISLFAIGREPRQTYTNLFYARGNRAIRYYTMEREEAEDPLLFDHDDRGITVEGYNAKQVSELLLRKMLNRLGIAN